jgi:LysM repeat protein
MGAMTHLNDRSSRRSYYARIGALLALASVGVLAACGSDDNSATNTLPPIATTTTTTTMPPTTTTIPSTYVIQKGESLSGIAKMFGLSTAELAAYNGITNPDDIQAGQTLKIPQPGETTTTAVPVATVDPAAQTSTT